MHNDHHNNKLDDSPPPTPPPPPHMNINNSYISHHSMDRRIVMNRPQKQQQIGGTYAPSTRTTPAADNSSYCYYYAASNPSAYHSVGSPKKWSVGDDCNITTTDDRDRDRDPAVSSCYSSDEFIETNRTDNEDYDDDGHALHPTTNTHTHTNTTTNTTSTRVDTSIIHGGYTTRGHWRPFEDEKLRELVAQHGAQNWNLIADQLQLGRSGFSFFLSFRVQNESSRKERKER